MFDRLISYFARQNPQSLAVTTLAGHLTYAEFDANIDRMAAALEELNPPRPGLVAVVIADQHIHWLLLVALARLGVTTCSYLAMQRAQMEPLLKPDFIITDQTEQAGDEMRPRIWRATPEWLGEVGKRPATPRPRVKIDRNSLARISTSSGTTGVPKKFGLSWAAVETRILQVAAIANSTHPAELRIQSLIGPEHLAYPGVGFTVWGLGGTMIFGPNDPVSVANTLTRLKPTVINMAPIQLKVLLDALPEGFLPLRDLSLTVSGSHTPRAVRELARMRLTNNLVLFYGTSEGGTIACRPDNSVQGDDADVGWVFPWTEVEIVDDNHDPLPYGSLGRVRARGTGFIDGYIDDDEANATYFHDGWFYPGDVGSLTVDGHLRVEGRVDEVMNFGGAKFMPHVIEGAVMACAGVRDAGLFTMPDGSGFAAPWIAIVRGENLREDDIAKALMIPGLPPVHVVWTDKVPRTPTGKVHRGQLQAAAKGLAKA
ncbi:MAG TPA: class I adenylate-forming enzyme family protein [Rhizomicrobium sp.]|jgi:acyl-CoA synthetase (AMP-forming)/AMP-acid ligase II